MSKVILCTDSLVAPVWHETISQCHAKSGACFHHLFASYLALRILLFLMTSENDVLRTTKALISATVHAYYEFKGFGRLVIK